MKFRRSTAALVRAAFLVCVSAGVVANPQPVQAQEAAATAMAEISDEKLAAFAAAYLDISALRDEVNNELGRVHDAQGKAAIRVKLEQKVTEILTQHELDAKQYQRLLYAVSAEPATRERFDRVMETLKPKPTTG
jgi:hypothetical protein